MIVLSQERNYCVNTDRYNSPFYVAPSSSTFSRRFCLPPFPPFPVSVFMPRRTYISVWCLLYIYIFIIIYLSRSPFLARARFFVSMHLLPFPFCTPFISLRFCLFSLRDKYICRLRIFNSQDDWIAQLCSFACYFSLYVFFRPLFLSFIHIHTQTSILTGHLFRTLSSLSLSDAFSFPFALSMYINNYLV